MSKKKGTMAENEAVDMGDVKSGELGLPALEEKYREQMRQIYSSKIDLPWLTLKTQIEQQISLRPDFQRRDRWNDEKRSRFIESVIMNVPVPPVFLGEVEYGKFEVLDGRQRLTAAYRFLNDELRLEGLQVWKELNGLTFSEIKAKGFAATIERRFLPAMLLTRESSPQVKFDVFDRLNTGGVIAAPMEIRNAIFPGPFNELLHELSREPHFRRLWGIPESDQPQELEKNVTYREMADLELVLRFFALRKGTLEGMRFKDLLSEVMLSKNDEYKVNAASREADAREFRQAVSNCMAVFGSDAFRPRKPGKKRVNRSAPYADAVMQALAGVEPDRLNEQVVVEIRLGFAKLSTETPEFIKAIDKGTNGETAIRTRIGLARELVAAAAGGNRADDVSEPASRRRRRRKV